jgi:hypothetical protein
MRLADRALMIAIHDAFTMDAGPTRLRRLRTRLITYLTHEEADGWPPISPQSRFPGELGGIAAAIRGGHSIRRTGTTISWALVGAGPDVRDHVLSRLRRPPPGVDSHRHRPARHRRLRH